MTEPQQPKREAGLDEIAGLRVYYQQADRVEKAIDWRNDRGISVAEAMAVKTTTVTKVTIQRMLEVLSAPGGHLEDPEALQAVIWMVRRHRMGEKDLRFTGLNDLDVLSIRQEFIDATGAEIDIKPDDPDPDDAELAADVAAAIGRLLPDLTDKDALVTATALVQENRRHREDTGAGEATAGDEPAAATTPTT